jgi:chromosome partitioning protein
MVENNFISDALVHNSAVGISFVHHKAVTGKTTSCLSVAGWLVKMKKKVLVVDLDPQGNATCGLGVDRDTIESSIYDVLFGKITIREIILETDSGIFLAPSSLDLLAAETHLAGKIKNIRLLKQGLADLCGHFDYVLIDAPPGSTLLMMMGIVACENIIIPMDTGVFAYETLFTLKSLVTEFNKELGVGTNLLMVLLKETSRSILDKYQIWEIKKLVREFLDENNMPHVKIMNVPFSRKIFRAQMKGIPVSHYAAYSDAARAYKKIAMEIINSV